jgi:U32 family peptidase
VSVRLEGPLKPGDGVVFDAGRPDLDEEGGRVYEVRAAKGEGRSPNAGVCPPASGIANLPEVTLTFGQGDIDFGRLHMGDRVWKTSDPELERRLRRTFDGDQPRFSRPVDMTVRGRAGQPLTLIVEDELGHAVELDSAVPLVAAEKQPLTPSRLREQLGRLGGTPFHLGKLAANLEGDVLVPVSELNRLRRDAVNRIEALRARPRRWTLLEGGTQNAAGGLGAERATCAEGRAGPGEPELVVLVRSVAQLDAALRCGVRTLYCELEDPKRYREVVRRFREGQADAPPPTVRSAHGAGPLGIGDRKSEIWVAPPRIAKPGEDWILDQVRSSAADGYLVRNHDQLRHFADCRRIGDYSLNVANALAAEYYHERHGLERLTASYDLNHAQLEALLRTAPPAWFEITLHQHMPLFHMEHCLFCAFLSSGTDFRNCGRPCDHREVHLRDRVGARHPVKADAGCRNTVFNALAQTGAEHVARFLAAGARRFRVEFLDETPDQVALTIRRYQQLLRGEMTGAQLWRELKLFNQLGVTRGPMG